MPQSDPTHAERATLKEPGPQPDPMLTEGRSGAARNWTVTFGIVAVVLLVMYGLTARHEEQSATADAPTSPPVTTPK